MAVAHDLEGGWDGGPWLFKGSTLSGYFNRWPGRSKLAAGILSSGPSLSSQAGCRGMSYRKMPASSSNQLSSPALGGLQTGSGGDA